MHRQGEYDRWSVKIRNFTPGTHASRWRWNESMGKNEIAEELVGGNSSLLNICMKNLEGRVKDTRVVL